MSEKNILITIGIPFYKDRDTLSYAIKSVQKQTWKNFELILLDDGGNDGSLEVANKFLDDPRIRIVSDGQNKGLPQRLNELIDMANGKYFARMDADDIMHPHRIEKQVEYLEAHNEVDVLGTGAYSINNKNIVLGMKKPKPSDFTVYDLFRQTAVMHPTVMAKTSWYRKHKYSTDIRSVRAEDFELWCRSWEDTNFYNLKECLMFYREGNSIKKSIRNQILTYKNSAYIISKYGKKYVSNFVVYRLQLKYYIKIFVFIVLAKTNTMDFVFARIIGKRYLVIDENTRSFAQKELNKIIY